eukprot:scaffold10054_cov133-Isochrysis_galbana.AAC.1
MGLAVMAVAPAPPMARGSVLVRGAGLLVAEWTAPAVAEAAATAAERAADLAKEVAVVMAAAA